jgi:hypothetical protein
MFLKAYLRKLSSAGENNTQSRLQNQEIYCAKRKASVTCGEECHSEESCFNPARLD